MSVQSEITRISTNVSDTLNAVSELGGTVAAGATSDDMAGAVRSIGNAVVRYDVEQTLTDDQKEQARTNIGAMPSGYTAPVESVNGQIGAVTLTAEDVGALPDDTVIPDAYTLPVATADTLGGVKVGEGMTIDADGVLTATAKELYVLYSGGVSAGVSITVPGVQEWTAFQIVTDNGSALGLRHPNGRIQALGINQDAEGVLSTIGVRFSISGETLTLDNAFKLTHATSGSHKDQKAVNVIRVIGLVRGRFT